MAHPDASLAEHLAGFPELSPVILSIAVASREIAAALAGGALRGHLGGLGVANVQGEDQQKMDVLADQILRRHLEGSGGVAAIASEEHEGIWLGSTGAPWLVAYDPLDGSSNLEVNISVGTIFSVRRAAPDPVTEADFLVPGREQVAAGYVLYGPSTTLALTTGRGVHMFTLDPESGEYVCTRSHVEVPACAQELAINVSNRRRWDPPVRRWVDEMFEGADGPRGRDFNLRWIATLVAEVHRILTRGGVFSYPLDARLRADGRAGRLRLVYELAPMAMLLEQAGGAASDGCRPLSAVVPRSLHARAPAFLGASDEVARVVRYHREA